MYENLTYMAEVQLSCTSSVTVIASPANTEAMVSSVLLLLLLLFVPMLTLGRQHLNLLAHTIKMPA